MSGSRWWDLGPNPGGSGEGNRLRPPGGFYDTGLGIIATISMLVELLLLGALGAPGSRAFGLNAAYIAARGLLLCFRRRFPLTVSLLLSASFTPLPDPGSASGWTDIAIGNAIAIVPLLAIFTVVSERGRVAGTVAALGFLAATPVYWAPPIPFIGPAPILYFLLVTGAAFAGGEVNRRLAAAREQLVERMDQLDEARRRVGSDAASAERERLASELQQVIGSAISRMVEAAVEARAFLSEDRAVPRASERIADIEGSGRLALTEARRALGVLRGDGPAPREPATVGEAHVTPPRVNPPPENASSRRSGRLVTAGDLALAGVMLAFLASEVYASTASAPPPTEEVTGGFGFVLGEILRNPADMIGRALLVVPLIGRKAWPLGSALVAAAGFGAMGVWGHDLSGLGPFLMALLATYWAWAFAGRRAGIVAAAAASLATVPALGELLNVHRTTPFAVYVVLYPVSCFLGERMRRLREAIEILGVQADELERLRALEEGRARTEERLRIAREFHDVTAHSLSVMTIQAGAARTIIGSRPQRAREALSAVESAGRDAMAQLARIFELVGMPSAQVPQERNLPGIGDLPALADQARLAGVAVELDVDPPPKPLPSGLDISLYRLVQEALTNIVKHAGPTTAVVRLRCAEDSLELDIRNEPGPGRPRVPGTRGHGLIGMRERTAMLGGAMQARPLTSGGFEVVVRLPLGRVDA